MKIRVSAAKRKSPVNLDAILTENREARLHWPNTIYQYTSWVAFEAIIQGQRIRLSRHTKIRDDPNEIASADSIILDVARELRKDCSRAQGIALNRFLRPYPRYRPRQHLSLYLACYSESRDSRDLWRKFGNDTDSEEGTGICLGFTVLRAEEGPGPETETGKVLSGHGSDLLKVEYSEDALRAEVRSHFERILARADELDDPASIAAALAQNAAMSAICYKPGDVRNFAVEQEWRKVVAFERTRNDEFVWMPFRWSGLATLAEVRIGPTPKRGNTVERAQRILRDRGYGVVAEQMPAVLLSEHRR